MVAYSVEVIEFCLDLFSEILCSYGSSLLTSFFSMSRATCNERWQSPNVGEEARLLSCLLPHKTSISVYLSIFKKTST